MNLFEYFKKPLNKNCLMEATKTNETNSKLFNYFKQIKKKKQDIIIITTTDTTDNEISHQDIKTKNDLCFDNYAYGNNTNVKK